MIRQLFKMPQLRVIILNSRNHYFYGFQGLQLPYQFRHRYEPWQKDILYKQRKRLIPEQQTKYYDCLMLPGYDEKNISSLLTEFRQRKISYSPSSVCMLIHMFAKYHVMTYQVFEELQNHAYKHRGQFQARPIFGGLRASLQYNKMNLANFFIEQYKGCSQRFTLQQLVQILEALKNNKFMQLQRKSNIWYDSFHTQFSDAIQNLKFNQVSTLVRVFDALQGVGVIDQLTMKRMIELMRGVKKGWGRISILQRLYSLSGTYEEAKVLFDSYFTKMSKQRKILKKYNLSEMRYHTPLQLIKQAQQRPDDYYPKFRTLIPEGENVQEWNKKFELYKKIGAVKQQQQVIKDKSKALGFAIRDRFEQMSEDNIDYTKMTPEEFEEMFGNYDQTVKTIESQDVKQLKRDEQNEKKQRQKKQKQEREKKQAQLAAGNSKKKKKQKKGQEKALE